MAGKPTLPPGASLTDPEANVRYFHFPTAYSLVVWNFSNSWNAEESVIVTLSDAVDGPAEHPDVAGKLARDILDSGGRKDRLEFWYAGHTSDPKPLNWKLAAELAI